MHIRISSLIFQMHYVWFMHKCSTLRLDCFPLKVDEGIVTYKCGCVGVTVHWMVAVWEGKDGALFETGRIGADKKKQKNKKSYPREKHKSSPVWTSALWLDNATRLHPQNKQRVRISFHQWIRRPLLWCILEISGKKTKNKRLRWNFNISSGETEMHSLLQPVKSWTI